ncbi:hypothetical protein WA026_022975 [Henosepilachna vigintioctopunctata]|uniref:Uncharacterized protein n=1 Tax=Henosepilachna vigintioctopunctata TaxID=420089 RepID=A0AAW1TYW6_9CUCU
MLHAPATFIDMSAPAAGLNKMFGQSRGKYLINLAIQKKRTRDDSENCEATVASGLSNAHDRPMEVVNEGHSEQATLENLGSLELLGFDKNIIFLENVSDQVAGVNIWKNKYQINHQQLMRMLKHSSTKNWSSDSDEQYQHPRNNSTASIESDYSQPPSNNSTASIELDGSIRVASVLQAENNEQSATVRKRKNVGERGTVTSIKDRRTQICASLGFKKNVSGKYKEIQQIDEQKIGPRLSDGNGGKVKKQVCKQMFMHTISIGKRPLRDWVKPPETTSSQASTSIENISGSENAIRD